MAKSERPERERERGSDAAEIEEAEEVAPGRASHPLETQFDPARGQQEEQSPHRDAGNKVERRSGRERSPPEYQIGGQSKGAEQDEPVAHERGTNPVAMSEQDHRGNAGQR